MRGTARAQWALERACVYDDNYARSRFSNAFFPACVSDLLLFRNPNSFKAEEHDQIAGSKPSQISARISEALIFWYFCIKAKVRSQINVILKH